MQPILKNKVKPEIPDINIMANIHNLQSIIVEQANKVIKMVKISFVIKPLIFWFNPFRP